MKRGRGEKRRKNVKTIDLPMHYLILAHAQLMTRARR